MAKKLTEKEELFCQYFVRSFNRTQSAIKAKYSINSATEIGAENYRKPHIKARIKELLEENIDPELLQSVLNSHLKNITLFDIKEYMNNDGSIDFKKLKKCNIPGIISGVRTQVVKDKDGKILNQSQTIKLTDQLKSLELLAKLMQYYNDMVINANADTMKIEIIR